MDLEEDRENRLSTLRQNIRNNSRRRERANEAQLANSTVIAIRVRRTVYRQQRHVDISSSKQPTHLYRLV